MIDILAIGAHPDDIEFGCGGILAKMHDQGKSIIMVDLTSGEKGTHGTPNARQEEGLNSARLINAERIFLNFSDCTIMDSYEGRLEIVKIIRQSKPRLILAPMWHGVQNHPDHTACGIMARHACRYARFPKILPEIPIHRPEGILHYLQRNSESPRFIIDISKYVDTWKKMIECYESQMQTCNYLDWNLRAASRLGMLIDVPFAQGLTAGNPVVIDDIMTLSQGTQEL